MFTVRFPARIKQRINSAQTLGSEMQKTRTPPFEDVRFKNAPRWFAIRMLFIGSETDALGATNSTLVDVTHKSPDETIFESLIKSA